MSTHAPERGSMRVYLGAAPGVGTTFAMLVEGRARAERGTRVALGVVDTHGRKGTSEQLRALLGVLPRDLRPEPTADPADADNASGAVRAPHTLDIERIIRLRPDVVLVDDLAHDEPTPAGTRRRWQAVDALLQAGIDVITTVNIDQLESMSDVAASIGGTSDRSLVPDWFVRSAEQIQLVDQTPEALRRRLAHGNIFPPDQVDVEVAEYFRPGNLGALRELALLWLADRVDEDLQRYRSEQGLDAPRVARERVVVALSGAPGSDAVIRRAGRVATRLHAELLGVFVRPAVAPNEPLSEVLVARRQLLEALGGSYHEVAAADVADGLVDFALTHRATQLVIGSTKRSRWEEFTKGSIATALLRRAPDVDLHVVAQSRTTSRLGAPFAAIADRTSDRAVFGLRRLLLAWTLAIIGPVALSAVLVSLPEHLGLAASLLAYLALVVVVAVTGGTAPATLAGLSCFALANYLFTVPKHTFTIDEAEDFVALVVFIGVAVLVGSYVSRAARRTAVVSTTRSHAETLASLAGSLNRDDDPLTALLEQLRSSFGAAAAGIYRQQGGRWMLEFGVGPAPENCNDAALSAPAGDGLRLGLTGVTPSALDGNLLAAFGASVSLTVERRALRDAADQAARLAEVDELRSGLLSAVSHDLRTPLAIIKANASTLRQSDVQITRDITAELLGEVEVQADRLTAMVTNLMDLGRLQVGATRSQVRPVELGDVVDAALATVATRGVRVDVGIPDDLPLVLADPPLLERVIANLLDNACKWSPADLPVVVEAASVLSEGVGQAVSLRISDRGPGVSPAARSRMFEPFQRVGDSGPGGTGLGLAVVRGFCDAMGATVTADDTPGGGLSMTVTIPVAP